MSESEGEDAQIINITDLRAPLELGWKRETVIRGLTKTGQIKGDVYYFTPGGTTKLKNISQILAVRLKKKDRKNEGKKNQYSFKKVFSLPFLFYLYFIF